MQQKYWYRLKQIDLDGSFVYSGAISVEVAPPLDFEFRHPFPNPFNAGTSTEYRVPRTVLVRIEIFNTLGQRVRTLISEEQPAGFYKIRWDGADDFGRLLPSALYIYRIKAGEFVAARKVLMLK